MPFLGGVDVAFTHPFDRVLFGCWLEARLGGPGAVLLGKVRVECRRIVEFDVCLQADRQAGRLSGGDIVVSLYVVYLDMQFAFFLVLLISRERTRVMVAIERTPLQSPSYGIFSMDKRASLLVRWFSGVWFAWRQLRC